MDKPKTFAEITEATKEAWKKKYPEGIYLLTVEDKQGFVRKPDRDDLKAALSMQKHGGEIAMLESLLQDTWIGGDQEIFDDVEYFMGAVSQINGLVQAKTGEIKKY